MKSVDDILSGAEDSDDIVARGRAALAANPNFPPVCAWKRWRAVSWGNESVICMGHAAAWQAAAQLRAKYGSAYITPHAPHAWGDSPRPGKGTETSAVMAMVSLLYMRSRLDNREFLKKRLVAMSQMRVSVSPTVFH